MRRFETWMGSLLWAAVAVLMPLAALEPVGAAAAEEQVSYDLSVCADGGAYLAMGCESIHL